MTDRYYIPPECSQYTLVHAAYLLLAILHTITGLSLNSSKFAVAGIRTVIELAFEMTGDAGANRVIADIPVDVTVILDRLHVKPVARGYVCCARCFACYDLDSYPDRCTKVDAEGETACNAILRKPTRKGGSQVDPVRRYLHHDMNEWMARLLCRPDLERWLDRRVLEPQMPNQKLRDIWDGSILRDFKGFDGENFTTGKRKSSEGRYVWSLCMDGFNPFHTKEAGKKVSVGAIYMVCLNLPPSLRYRIENVFLVGIIPGPSSPSTHQINEILKPLVHDLLMFWNPGVFFRRTFSYPKGRLIRCAIVPLVCDLPAARQMSGFGSHSSSHFCSFCRLQLHDLDNLDMNAWGCESRTYQEHVTLAQQWRDGDSRQRATIFESHGIRWSELLSLPYWDPTRFVVLDSMHALLLGCLRHHACTLWGMNVDIDDTKVPQQASRPSDAQVLNGWRVLRHGSDAKLEALPQSVLKEICQELQCPIGRRNRLIDGLKHYVRIPAPWDDRRTYCRRSAYHPILAGP